MNSCLRKHYIDNLRWLILLILIPYHTSMAWNVWHEPNYIFFEGNKVISSIVVFFSPYFMPLLFVLAGISTKFALKKRTYKDYVVERLKRLFIPFLFGVLVIMPFMTYIGDVFNYSYNKGFIQHYSVFFTKYTDLIGADGGFSLGQFWFLLYLLIISFISVIIIKVLKKFNFEGKIPFWLVIMLGLPLPFLSDCISIGGKSLVEYTYLFMIGYFVLSDSKNIDSISKNGWVLFGIGLIMTVFNVYLFIWSSKELILFNNICKYVSEWFMIISLLGLSNRYLNFSNDFTSYMKTRSFLVYIYHFIWVVLVQYFLYSCIGNNTCILFIGTILLSSFMTFVCCEVSIRIPLLCFLTGIKGK